MSATPHDHQYDPTEEPQSSKAWLALIEDAERQFNDWQDKADNIDRLYADLSRMAKTARDREFQMFWANIQVLAPSIYSRPPVPVVVPRFKDRRPVPRMASELLERATVVSFELADIDGVMRLVRDDLVLPARGVAWVRYETKSESDTDSERICVEHIDRKDFLHEPARKWHEVGWVARRGWLTMEEGGKRFGEKFEGAAFKTRRDDRDNGASSPQEKAGVWEIWSKTHNKVVWVVEGVDEVLDSDKPHLKLEGFYPCPRPAYGTTQRRSLVPVPDFVFYKDQLEEINELTARISALTDAVQVRAFVPGGAGEISDAIEAALKMTDNRFRVIPISNWAAFGNGSAKDSIVWLPVDMIVGTITQLVELRRQLIADVYEITGLSDVMRGATDARETATAQQLKSQYGSIRIRDRQSELVRLARDLVRIAAEIMAENFSQKTLLEMSQLELPTKADIKRQVAELEKQAKAVTAQVEQQVQQAQANPQIAQMAQEDPEQLQQMVEQVQQQAQQQVGAIQEQAQKLNETVTIDAVMDLLKEQRLRPFVLDIETDSTIQPDEDAEKQRRTEFITALGGLIQQMVPMIQSMPQAAAFGGEIIKFAAAPYRVGRELEGKIDEFVQQMAAMAGQGQPNPEAEAAKAQAEAEQQRGQQEMQLKAAELQARQQETQAKIAADERKAQLEAEDRQVDRAFRQQESDAKLRHLEAQMIRDERKGALEERKLQMEMERMEREAAIKAQEAEIDAAAKMQTAEIQAASAAQQAQQRDQAFEQQSAQSQREFEQKSTLAEQQAAQKAADQASRPRP